MRRPIQVMLSSRCQVDIPSGAGKVTLSNVRLELKKKIERMMFVNSQRAFDVWINEEGGPGPGDESAWEYCLERARECDLFVSIFDGQSGWIKPGETEGICEAELEAAMDSDASRVRIIRLDPPRPRKTSAEAESDARFKDYIEKFNRFRSTATDAASLETQVLTTVQAAVVEMALRGGPPAKGYLGQALVWNRLSFVERKALIERELANELTQRPRSRRLNDQTVVTPIGSKNIAIRCAGLPAPISVAAARELVGQPFLRDHELVEQMKLTDAGPVHLIGCHTGLTESQARRQLGFPDAIVVTTPQGVWVADPVQNIQVLYLRNCVDVLSTRVRLQNALEWLEESGEANMLAERAAKRARIARAVAKEVS